MASGSGQYNRINKANKDRIARDGTVKSQRKRFAAQRTAAQGRTPRIKA